MGLKERLHKNIAESRAVLDSLEAVSEELERAADIILSALKAGNKLLVCGNGGSASDAMHFTCELVGRYLDERDPFPAICLNGNPADLTCIVNDYGYEAAFSRQVHAFGKPDDVLITFSSSGRSANVLKAILVAKSKGLKRVSFIGKDGGDAKGLSDVDIIIPSETTARIQETHTLLLHTLLDQIDNMVNGDEDLS
ncbi:MAG: SIS domain-containing protein [Verrucomicrobiota bacterium]